MSVDDRLRAGLRANATAFEPAVESGLDEVPGPSRTRRAGGGGGRTGRGRSRCRRSWSSSPPADGPWTGLAPATSPTVADRCAVRPLRVRRDAASPSVGAMGAGVRGATARSWSSPPEGYAGVVSGTMFTADASRLRTNLFAQDVCADLGNGEFSWTRSEARLALADSDEPCAARSQFLTENNWVAVSEP